MDFNKIPRNILIPAFLVTLGLCGFFTQRAVADMDKVKAVAYTAKNLSDNNQASIVDLKGTVDRRKQMRFITAFCFLILFLLTKIGMPTKVYQWAIEKGGGLLRKAT